MKSETGQSLLELIIAIGIFVTVISSLAFFILESFISGRFALEITIANFLAEEGIEATRSIRDNSWSDILIGDHGLAISGNHWVFQGNQEDISSQLRGGVRIITIENIDSDRKKISSKINWEFGKERLQEVQLITYLTNWQKETLPSDCVGTPDPCGTFGEETPCLSQDGCAWTPAFCGGACTPCGELNRGRCRRQAGCRWFLFTCLGTCTSCDSFSDQSPCEDQLGCTWYPESCSGIPISCETYITEEDCLSQSGCEWTGE